MPLERATIREALRVAVTSVPGVLAMWEAGSAAFGRVDDLSDLDVGILAEPVANAAIWDRAEAVFGSLGGVLLRWHEPNPVFQGLDKATFRLRRASRWLQVDLGIFTRPTATLYNEPARHGSHHVLYDPHGLTIPPPWDPDKHRVALRRSLHHVVQKQALYHDYFAKELVRRRPIDALRMYQAYCVGPVVAVLGMLHRRERWDFDLRYVHADFPVEDAAVVQRLCYVGDPGELPARAAEADALFRDTVRRLVREGLEPEGDARDVRPEWLRSGSR